MQNSVHTGRRQNRFIYGLIRFRGQIFLQAMVLPAMVWLIVFHYIPMYGIIIAFTDYKISEGFFGGKFVELKHFIAFFTDKYAIEAIRNTLIFFFLFPVWYVIVLSFNNANDTSLGGVIFWPRKFTLRNYEVVFQNEAILNSYIVTILRTIVGTLVHVVFTGMFAYSMSKKKLMFRDIYFTIMNKNITLFMVVMLLFNILGACSGNTPVPADHGWSCYRNQGNEELWFAVRISDKTI